MVQWRGGTQVFNPRQFPSRAFSSRKGTPDEVLPVADRDRAGDPLRDVVTATEPLPVSAAAPAICAPDTARGVPGCPPRFVEQVRASSIARLKAFEYFGVPKVRGL